MIALCSVSGRNFDIHFLANFMRGVVGPLAWVMIVMLAVVLVCFVRFDHLVIGFGDHFWVLLRDTVLLVNVIVYLIVCLIFFDGSCNFLLCFSEWAEDNSVACVAKYLSDACLYFCGSCA